MVMTTAANSAPQRITQAPEGVERPYQHGSHRNRADIVVPDRKTEIGPSGRAVDGQLIGQLGIQKEDEGYEHQPGQHPTGEVDGRQPGTDDVAHAHQRRAGRR
jgi:hypothetical protein